MSERRSWDVQRKPAGQPQGLPAAPSRTPSVPTRIAVRPQRAAPPAKEAPVAVRSAPRRAPLRPNGALRESRKKKRRTVRYVILFILLVFLGGAIYLLWQPSFRIQTVNAYGPDSDTAKAIVSMKTVGTYWYVIPRNSVFFYSKAKIRSAILDAQPDVSAVSLTRTSFSSIEVRTTPRAVTFEWCGIAISTQNPTGCLDADIEGFLFKQAVDAAVDMQASTSISTSTASTTPTIQPVDDGQIRVFSALDRDISGGQSPLRAHVISPALMPDAIKFVNAIRALGAPVSALAIRGDEADLWLNGPTRITYVLGHEQDAATLAASVIPTLNLTNGSIQYVDLRFPGKAYIKRYGQ